jgi:hypothetical protein
VTPGQKKVYEDVKRVLPRRYTVKLEDLTDVPSNEDTYNIEIYDLGKKMRLYVCMTGSGYTVNSYSPDGKETQARVVHKGREERVSAHLLLMLKEYEHD